MFPRLRLSYLIASKQTPAGFTLLAAIADFRQGAYSEAINLAGIPAFSLLYAPGNGDRLANMLGQVDGPTPQDVSLVLALHDKLFGLVPLAETPHQRDVVQFFRLRSRSKKECGEKRSG
jgi:hypothetical protein